MVESTEDLQSYMDGFNSLPPEARKDLVVLSMDAAALYPSIAIERSAEVVHDLLLESQVVYESINVTELSRYLDVAVDADIVTQSGLNDYAMTSALEMEYEWKESKSSWVRARKVPDEGELRKMFAFAV